MVDQGVVIRVLEWFQESGSNWETLGVIGRVWEWLGGSWRYWEIKGVVGSVKK